MLLDSFSMTAIACYTSFSTRCTRLVSRLMVGFGILDTRASAAALVFCAEGLAADVVCDLVLRAGAAGGTLIGLDTILRLCFTTFCGWTGKCVVVGCILGAGVCTLGVGVVIGGALMVMDLVACIFAGALGVSALGTG